MQATTEARDKGLTSTSICNMSFPTSVPEGCGDKGDVFFSLQLSVTLRELTYPSSLELDDERDVWEDDIFVLSVGSTAILLQLSMMVNASLQSITVVIDGALNMVISISIQSDLSSSEKIEAIMHRTLLLGK